MRGKGYKGPEALFQFPGQPDLFLEPGILRLGLNLLRRALLQFYESGIESLAQFLQFARPGLRNFLQQIRIPLNRADGVG